MLLTLVGYDYDHALGKLSLSHKIITIERRIEDKGTVVPGFKVLGFSALPGFRALKAGDGAWSVHKTLFGFKAPI